MIYTISQEIGIQAEIGTIREIFFINQFDKNLFYSYIGDFLLQLGTEKYYFEIGGKNKKRKQLQGKDNTFVVADSIIFPSKGKILIWLFGFMEK